MNSTISIRRLLLAAAIWSGALGAQSISLTEFLGLVRDNHPLFEKETLATMIEEQAREASLGGQDWQITSSPSYFHQTPLATSSFSPKSLDQIRTGVAAEKAFWNSGGRLSLSWSSDMTDQKLDDIIIPFTPDPLVIPLGEPRFYQNDISLSYTQPLLQNYRGELVSPHYYFQLCSRGIRLRNVQQAESRRKIQNDT